ncbi:metal ABC transporter permease [bacterium endosymbiont of Bathymodiolus sp. 5 South]|uniref:metal ABC transporter permease n=1 Tax=bacterium endosymbiont of Bathymodiolus sp. 5 South TaxID=1181670 RepID=UPI0010AF98D0|nr:metal ABC transporter permease [bacterium endosymbiont of Bathymodiolus sp. 5 South]SSC07681.1 Zinc ABC transporter, inner membrane permease protein ZnuB [bacterium endosymbiont of Bathymodiolus sp. 5 South]VVH63700.1 Zinc ABC transporter, permease protein ZnuB [uncultured Gammaproteobacteria bacterium]VVM27491.1 Zinc ABC transporter, inner membrane permease protein ZnuB [uncultured Gammaproteobacteria bacterium]
MEDFIFRALLAAIGISIIAGSLGCFVIWRRMSYFSESISHSALLGVSLGLISGLDIHIGLIVVGVLFATLIVALQQKDFLSNDAILGIFSHIALSLGIVVLALVGGTNTDYFSLLFGDILSISNQDIIWIYTILILVGVLLSVFWQRLLLLTLNEELGVASGLNRFAYQLLFMLMIALTVSVSVQIVGVLLITSLLIIPPAIARVFAGSPVQMVFLSIVVSIIAVVVGLNSSIYYDVATGPAIVIALGVLFGLSQLFTSKTLA